MAILSPLLQFGGIRRRTDLSAGRRQFLFQFPPVRRYCMTGFQKIIVSEESTIELTHSQAYRVRLPVIQVYNSPDPYLCYRFLSRRKGPCIHHPTYLPRSMPLYFVSRSTWFAE
jgi:hypothetical protein